MLDINIDKIKDNYGFGNILDEISFDINSGDKIGIVGNNGSGKSTLLKLIIGKDKPVSGRINIRKNLKIGYLSQIIDNYDDNLNVKDIMYYKFKDILNMKKQLKKIEGQFENCSNINNLLEKYNKVQTEFILKDGYNLDEVIFKTVDEFKIRDLMNKKFNSLSEGQKTICLICSIVINNPDSLILDEPTNHLDIKALDLLENYLNKFKGSVLVVSHDRYFLDKITNKTLLIENGRGIIFQGNYSYYFENNKIRNQKLLKDYKDNQKEIKRLQQSAKRLREFGSIAKNEMFYKRARNIENRIEKIDIIAKPIRKSSLTIDFVSKERTGNDVLTIKNYSFGYDNLLFNNINLFIKYRDRVALIGNNGCGKSTLINKIINNEFELGSRVKLGYIPQIISFEKDDNRVIDEAKVYFDGDENNLRSALFKFNFKGDDIYKRLNKISGGEKVRLKLFKLIQQNCNFLLLDEPTNHIDIETRKMLELALNEFDGTILFVSHDRYFINNVATKILEIKDKKLYEYNGNYDDYLIHSN